MKKLLIITIIILGFNTYAQEYKQAIGLRGGLYNGITYKNFITNNTAIEGILQTRWHGFGLVGLLEHHKDFSSVNNLYWFYGYGAHIGFYDTKYTHWDTAGTSTVVGVDGIIGIEYDIPGVPIAIGLDWKPYVNLIGYSHFFGDGGAFSVRYTF